MEIKPAMVAIAAFVVITVIAAVLMPVLGDATETHRTFTNDEYYITMDKLDSSSSHTITWTKDTQSKITVDGIDVTPTWNQVSIVALPNNLVRSSNTPDGYFIGLIGEDVTTGYGSPTDKSITVTISAGSLTFAGVTTNDNTYSKTITFTEGYVINPDNTGEYGYITKTPTAKAYVNGDTEIFGIGYSTVGGTWQNVFSISGTIDDGITVSLISTSLGDDPTISNEQTVYETVSGYKDLYQFEKETFTATYNGTDTPLTYSYVIVPAEVTAEKSIHLTDSENAILLVIPALLIVAIIIGVLAVAMRGRE